MKNFSTLLSTILLIFAAFLFSNYSGNPPNGKTGAPGDNTCAQCHGGNTSYQGTISLSGIPDTIAPATTYSVTMTLKATSGSPAKGGFQLVALNSSNQNAGTITTTDSQTGTDFYNNRTYLEHRPAKAFTNNEVAYTFDWMSPETTEDDDITLYFCGNFANGDSSSNGDKTINSSFSTHLKMNISDTKDPTSTNKINIFPNPSTGLFTIKYDRLNQQNINWTVFDIHGNKVLSGNNSTVNLTNQARGVYFVKFINEGNTITKKITIQ